MSDLMYKSEKPSGFCLPGIVLILLFSITLFAVTAAKLEAQNTQEARNTLAERGEVYFRILTPAAAHLQILTEQVSIDRISGGYTYVYANAVQFEKFLRSGIKYELLAPPSSVISLKTSLSETSPKNSSSPLKSTAFSSSPLKSAAFSSYPSYAEYINMMSSFADNYPDLCVIDTIGLSVFNRLILVAKISDHVQEKEKEPVLFYSSTMHGDETTAYVLMLNLIDHLLSQYGQNDRITGLVNNIEIWINPLANPDGTYFYNDASVSLATRLNANNVDLNRNFPDPDKGENPDGQPYQPETLGMMDFMKEHMPDLSANFHGGAEVVNYPWDTWPRLHADNNWFHMISKEYADTVIAGSNNYFLEFTDGVTNGFDWYTTKGNRQDYVTYFLHGREVTIEISNVKTPAESELPALWEYNRNALLNYMEQCLFGFSGTVTDADTGEPLKAKIEIPGHDLDRSFIYSDSLSGTFFRYLKEGFYSITFEASGYQPETLHDIQITDRQSLKREVSLKKLEAGIQKVGHAPGLLFYGSKIIWELEQETTVNIIIYDLAGRQAIPVINCQSVRGANVIDLQNRLPNGLYIVRLEADSNSMTGKILLLREP